MKILLAKVHVKVTLDVLASGTNKCGPRTDRHKWIEVMTAVSRMIYPQLPHLLSVMYIWVITPFMTGRGPHLKLKDGFFGQYQPRFLFERPFNYPNICPCDLCQRIVKNLHLSLLGINKGHFLHHLESDFSFFF